MNMNQLKLNEYKTEFFVASSKSNLNYVYEPFLNVCGTIIKPSEAVRNLGVISDSAMSMSSHFSSISRSLNYHLRNIGRIRRYINNNICHHAISSLVISRIDYCYSLFYGQSAKNTQKLKKKNTKQSCQTGLQSKS